MDAAKRILVIDDEPYLRQALIDMLSFLGYEAVGANDGLRGLEMAIEQGPDLIIADVVMPHMDGYEFLEHIHDNPQTRTIPVILLSAVGACQAKRRGLSLGALRYMPKPVEVEELVSVVQGIA